MQNFGKRLARRRTEAGLTIAELARRLGMSHDHLAALEAGAERPPACEVMEIAAALEIDPELLFESGSEPSDGSNE
jgi:transcriptional regulator with XRE-family HTH domain